MALVLDSEIYKDGATGDMYYRNSSGLLVPVSGTQTTGYVPTKQSDGTIAWASPSAGSSAEVLITETVLGGTSSNVSFTTITGIYRDIRAVASGRGDKSASASCEVRMRFNNDTGSNYDYQLAIMNQANDADIEGRATTYIFLGYLTGATGAANQPGTVNARIFDYRGTTFYKAVQSQNYTALVTSSGGFLYPNVTGGDWRSTSAITRVDVFPDSGNFIAGTRVSLYGIF